MKTVTKRKIKNSLDRVGLHISPASSTRPLNLSAATAMDPVTAIYASGGRDVLINAPLAECRTLNLSAFPPTKTGGSPFVQTIQNYYEREKTRYEHSALCEFYDCYKPQSASDLLGLTDPSYKKLLSLPPSAAFFPWRAYCIDRQPAIRNKQIGRENREHGSRLGCEHGDPLYGPVSNIKGELEFKRLIAIANSIRTNGVKVDGRGLNNITVVGLISDDEWRLAVVNSGQHRLSALGALGFHDAVVQLRVTEGSGGLVRRCDVHRWPAVRSGIFSEAEALFIFDRLFNGQKPEIATRWLSSARWD